MRPVNSNRPTSLSAEALSNFATQEQRQALATGNKDALQKADERALAAAVLASLADIKDESLIKTPSLMSVSTKKSSFPAKESSDQKNISPKPTKETSDQKNIPSKPATLTEDYYEANRKITSQLRGWFHNHGFSIVHNSGRNLNCLLISMMQHKTGNYDSEHDADVDDLRQKVKDYTEKHYPNNPSMNDYSLNSDDDLTVELMKEINKGITDPQEKFSFYFVTADSDGEPSWRRRGDGHKVAIIFDQGGHYEAVVPRSA